MSVHSETAQGLVGEIRTLRQKIPNLVVPSSKDERVRLASAAAVPAPFVERIAVAVENNTALVRNGATDPEKSRDLMAYAEAFGPLADEVEALARAIRHSVTVARNKAGRDALITYALAQWLAELPEHADLVPHVADMRRTLGPMGKAKKAKAEQPASTPPATTPTAPPATTSPAPVPAPQTPPKSS